MVFFGELGCLFFGKSEIEAKTLIVRVSDGGLWLKVGFMVIF